MTPVQTAKVLSVVGLLAAGQILFKLAAARIRVGSWRETLISLAMNPYLIVGVALYGITTALWVLVLRDVPISRAYPFTALAMIVVPAVGLAFFGESFSWTLVVGGVLLVAGIVVIGLR
jgi:drug/metabolite transporter (DMT)-like permease